MKSPETLMKEFSKVVNSYHKNTPHKIRDLREAVIKSAIDRPMSKNDLAAITGVGAQNVGKVEKDYNDTHSLNASIKFLIKIAIIFDVDMNFLVGLTEEPRRLSRLTEKNGKSKQALPEDKLDVMIGLQKQMLEALQS
jgi:transcriptional regulator with XRE-family HTH domain